MSFPGNHAKGATGSQLPLFVYGTLRPGQENYNLVRGYTVQEQPARLHNHELYACSAYPFAVSGKGIVIGDLFHIAPQQYHSILSRLDRLEGFEPGTADSLFCRIQHNVVLQGGRRIAAWVYQGNRAYLAKHPLRLMHGDWLRFYQDTLAVGRSSGKPDDIT